MATALPRAVIEHLSSFAKQWIIEENVPDDDASQSLVMVSRNSDETPGKAES